VSVSRSDTVVAVVVTGACGDGNTPPQGGETAPGGSHGQHRRSGKWYGECR
jgi:hypothetical protein